MVEIVSKLSFNNTELMAQAATVGTTISSFVCLAYLYKYYIIRKKDVWKEVRVSTYYKEERLKDILKGILIVAIPIALSSLFASMNKTIDALTIVRILKKIYTEKEATMQYGILTGKIETLISLPFSFNASFSTALIPEISSSIVTKNYKTTEKKLNFSMVMSLLIGIVCTLFIEAFSKQIIGILFPNAASGEEMLKMAAIDIIPVVLIQTINGALHGLGKTNITVVAFAIGGIVKFILNIILIPIPKIGIYGAIISTIISHSISLIICYIVLKKNIHNIFNFREIIDSYGKKRYKNHKIF